MFRICVPLDDAYSFDYSLGNGSNKGTNNEPLNETINEPLNEDEKTIIDFIQKNPSATKELVAEGTGLSLAKVKRLFTSLQKKEIVSRQGSKKNGKWVVSDGRTESSGD